MSFNRRSPMTTMFSEDNNLRNGKDDWKKFIESRQQKPGDQVLREGVDKDVVPTPSATHIEDENPSDPELNGGECPDVVPTAKDKHIEDEAPADPKETKNVEAEELKEEEEAELELSMTDPEEGPDTSAGVETGDDGATPVSIGEEGIAPVPHRMQMDEKTQAKIDKLRERQTTMQRKLAELEEEIEFLTDLGGKESELNSTKDQVSALQEEIKELKAAKKGKKDEVLQAEENIEAGRTEEDFGEDPEAGGDSEEQQEADDEALAQMGLEEEKKEDMKESWARNLHTRGKIPGQAKTVDTVDVKNKKKRMVESGYQKYLQTRTSAEDSGEEPDGFSVVMG